MTKLLVSGLGGGLDIINALTLYYAAKNERLKAVIGSIMPAQIAELENHCPFSDSGSWVNPETIVHYGKYGGRYIEPRVSALLEEKVMFFSRKYSGKDDPKRLRIAIKAAQSMYGFTDMFFVDGGGDSLILVSRDACKNSQEKDPFSGGDAKVLEALQGIKNAYVAVIAAGLDISEERFQHNVSLLAKRKAYFGKVNLLTGEKEDYKLDHILKFKEGLLEPYCNLAEQVLVLKKKDFRNKNKMMSHTAVAAYHALKGNFGLRRTYVPWEPITNGRKGVMIKPEHCWMYFFKADVMHSLKKELNV